MADLSIFRLYDLPTLQAMLAGSIASVGSGGGQTIVKYSIGGREVEKQFGISQEDFINAVNWALELKDPAQYIPIIDRTRVSFGGTCSTSTGVS
jgi:hypothetical protein